MASLYDVDSSFLEAVPLVQIRQAAVRRRPVVLLITPVAILVVMSATALMWHWRVYLVMLANSDYLESYLHVSFQKFHEKIRNKESGIGGSIWPVVSASSCSSVVSSSESSKKLKPVYS